MTPWPLLLISTAISFAQVKPINTINLANPVQAAYVDRPGDLYLQFASGTIQKYDVNGKLIQEFAPQENLALFEPRDGARAFSFSRRKRWYSYAFFGDLNKTFLNEEYAIDPVMACSSGDKNIWVLDNADYSLKKVNTDRGTVEVEVLLPEKLRSGKPEIVTMREYQSFLFLLEKHSGIYIFSAMGKFLKTIESEELSYFNFLGEELYYPHKGKLIFFDLFDTTIREIELASSAKIMLLTDVRNYIIYANRVDIFTTNP